MFERPMITAFVSGALFGFIIAAIVAGWIWAHYSNWWVGKPDKKALDQKLVENMIEEDVDHG